MRLGGKERGEGNDEGCGERYEIEGTRYSNEGVRRAWRGKTRKEGEGEARAERTRRGRGRGRVWKRNSRRMSVWEC